MIEVWKDVVGFEGYYQVSNLGRVRSLDREVNCLKGQKRIVKGKILKLIPCTNDYLSVRLSVNNIIKMSLVHRLVATAFLPNTDNLPEVNHKDEVRTNNRLDNLEWCDRSYNIQYGTALQRMKESRKVKPVIQKDLNGNVIRRWRSVLDAGKGMGVNHSSIMRVCQGKQHTSMGYKWEYAQ